VSADGEQDHDDEEDQADEEDQDEVDHENQSGLEKAQMMSTPCSAHLLSESQLRNPDIAIPAASASSRRVSGLTNTATRATCHDIDNRKVLNNLRSLQQCHTSQPVDTDTPSLKVALNSQNSDLWEAAIHEELESLREAQTWDEIEAPKGAKVFPPKFMLKVKRHSDDAVERHKARLMMG
jgi:hypothetical protein